MKVIFTGNDKGNPPGKLADAELHFTDGVFEGMKLIGFGIWERRNGSGRDVTFPARQYSVNGERRSFALLRPVNSAVDQDRVRDLILEAYTEFEAMESEACENGTGSSKASVDMDALAGTHSHRMQEEARIAAQ